jgi:hypothetical protein
MCFSKRQACLASVADYHRVKITRGKGCEYPPRAERRCNWGAARPRSFLLVCGGRRRTRASYRGPTGQQHSAKNGWADKDVGVLRAAGRCPGLGEVLGLRPGRVRNVVSKSRDLKSRPAGGTYLLLMTQHFIQSPSRASYSTVTLFAKLRGLSTSQPRATAMW